MTPQTGDHHHHINPRCIYAARCARGPAHGVHPRSEDRAAQALHRVKSPALFLSSSYPLLILFLSSSCLYQRLFNSERYGIRERIEREHGVRSWDSTIGIRARARRIPSRVNVTRAQPPIITKPPELAPRHSRAASDGRSRDCVRGCAAVQGDSVGWRLSLGFFAHRRRR